MIKIKNLKKTWEDGNVVFQNINLSIEDGDIYALVGRSGAGKSTLLRCINGLTSYDEGNLSVDGREIKDMAEKELREFRRHVGMIFQHFSLLERKTVYQNIALPMECFSYTKMEINKKVNELLELVGLENKKDVKPKNLSGGQKQRVAIARALTMEPKFLLCDEATSALDPKTASSILNLLAEINRKIGITVVIVTHQMEVVSRACNKACILENGKIAYEGDVKSVFINPPNSLKRLLGEEDISLPTDGKNIRIAYSLDEENKEQALAQMAIKLNIPFKIISGRIQSFRKDKLGIFTINVKEEEQDKIKQYLEYNRCLWREINNDSMNEEKGI